jgi:ribosomal protein L2
MLVTIGSSLNMGIVYPGEIPLGTAIHYCLNRGGQIVRAGGTSAKL